MTTSDLPLDQIAFRPRSGYDADAWYWSIPAVASLRSSPLSVPTPVTVLVGENGSGKSTLVEAVALAWAGRLTAAVHHWGPQPSSEDTDLYRHLYLFGERPPPQGGCFLRAEAMHAHFAGIDRDSVELRAFEGRRLNTQSHGESFLAFLESRRYERGLYVLDEPEAALSFRGCLALLYLLGDAVAAGSQVIMATHSPLLAAFPGATVLVLSAEGIARRDWADLDFVNDWRDFLTAPTRWLRHLTD